MKIKNPFPPDICHRVLYHITPRQVSPKDTSVWFKWGALICTESGIFQPFLFIQVVDTKPPPLGRLYVYGVLELEVGRDHELKATHILISGLKGMLIVGWPKKPMLNNVIISLLGKKNL